MKAIRQAMFVALAGFCLLAAPLPTDASGDAPDGPVLAALLQAFLAGASKNDATAHDRFWSDDLVYTSSAGVRFGKADIMAGLESAAAEDPAVYSAEDIQVKQYGDTAVVAFRLVATPRAGDGDISEYFNTGTFVKNEGRWQAVAWQATKIPVGQ